MKLNQLRKKHSALEYQNYQIKYNQNNLKIIYTFKLYPDIIFKPTIVFKLNKIQYKKLIKDHLFHQLIFHLGLIEIPSYWKAACPRKIIIKAGHLSQEQINWWKQILIKGLGEFFYTNKIDFTEPNFVQIVNATSKTTKFTKNELTIKHTKSNNKYLVLVGGGKDSSTSLGLLNENNIQPGCLKLSPLSPSAHKIINQSQTSQVLQVQRNIDPQLIKLNKQGYLNGHTPFSAYLAFLGVLQAYLHNYSHVLVANEHSANQENIIYLNQHINHQYSKSYEFETKFRNYLKQFIFTNHNNIIQYISFLRPLNELQIASIFAKYKQYHQLFKSCNVNQQTNSWCHTCPKCVFVFTILFPFIDQNKLTNTIFEKNLFEQEKLLPIYTQLLGLKKHKPFECVGTTQETQVALFMAIKKYQSQEQTLPIILQKLKTQIEKGMNQEIVLNLLNSYDQNNYLTPQLETIIKKAINHETK